MSIHAHQILPLKLYLSIAGILFFLTGATVFAAYFNFGSFNLFIALFIATIKGTLVALYFMHLKYDNKLFMTLFVMSLVFLGIFIGITMLDTMFRDSIDPIRDGLINKDAIIYRDK